MRAGSIFLMLVGLLALCAVVPAGADTVTHAGPYVLNANGESTNFDDVWDLTQGDLVLKYTLDMSQIRQPSSWPTGWIESPPGSGNWVYDTTPTTDPNRYPDTYTPWIEVGMRGVGGDNFNPGPANTYQGKCGGWMTSESDDWLGAWTLDENGKVVLVNDGAAAQDGDDKHSLGATSGVGEWHYDVEDADGAYGYDAGWNAVLAMFGSHDSHGLWYDRDGVDQWQANAWENSGINAGRINTGGLYEIEITYHAIDAGLGVMFAKVNGVQQGFYEPSWHGGGMGDADRYPAGISFKGDMKQMQVFAGSFAYDPAGQDYGTVTLSGIEVTGTPGTADPLVADFTARLGAGNTVQFTDATHGGMAPYTYAWDFGDGSTSTEASPSHTYAAAGDYTVKLTVDPFRCTPMTVEKSVTVVPPAADMAVVKSGSVWTRVGEPVTYTYEVTNKGPASAAPTLTDDKCTPAYVEGDANNDGLVNPGETWKYTCTYTPTVAPYAVLTNTATVTPVGVEESNPTDNTDSYSLYWSVLRKDVLLYWQGHNVGYTDPNTAFTFVMSKDGVELGTFTIKESAPVYLLLSEGRYDFVEKDLPVGYEPARAAWWWEVKPGVRLDMSFENLIRFDLAVEKTCPGTAVAGETITYGYTVTNAGPAAVTPVLSDDKCGTPVNTGGDTNGDGRIQAGETWKYTASYPVPGDAGGTEITNIVTVKDAEDDYGTGWKLGGDTNTANNVDSCTVTVGASPPRPANALLPTQTTIQMYASGQWPPMYSAFAYVLKSGKINSVSPGVIFYYDTITAPGAAFTLDVRETNSGNWKPMLVQSESKKAQAYLYDANFRVVATGAASGTSPHTVTFNVKGATPGATYYVGIKYSPKNLVGINPSGGSSTYSWSTSINGVQVGSPATIPVVKK